MEFEIFIITQIIYVIVTFKSHTSSFPRALIVHITNLLGVYDWVLFVSKLINI